jgi:hypothetical protein
MEGTLRIDNSIELFLGETGGKISKKTGEKYKDVLWLFQDYLARYAELAHEEDKDGNIVLTANTTELTDGQVENFLEWFLIRKVMGPAWLSSSAPGIMKKYIKWLDQNGLVAEGAMDEALEVTKKATKDLPRVEKASELLYELCQMNEMILAGTVFRDHNYMEGYGEVTDITGDKLYLDYDREITGPVLITVEIARYLKKGDTINLVVGRKGKIWYALEVGNVYPGH